MLKKNVILAFSVLPVILLSSCDVGTSYMLRELAMEGLVPSSRIRVVPESEEPQVSAGVRMDLTTVGHVEGVEFPYPERWLSDSSGRVSNYRYAEPNIHWTRPEAAMGAYVDAYVLKWLAPSIDIQLTQFGGTLLPTFAGGIGLLFRGDRFGGRLDGTLKLTRLKYKALLVDEANIGPDIVREGTEYARGFAVQATNNTLFDFLFLRYYISAGYEQMNFNDDIEGEMIRTDLRQAYAAAGAFRDIGPVTAIAGIRGVMLNGTMLDMDPQRYLEPNFQIMGNIKLPRLRERG